MRKYDTIKIDGVTYTVIAVSSNGTCVLCEMVGLMPTKLFIYNPNKTGRSK